MGGVLDLEPLAPSSRPYGRDVVEPIALERLCIHDHGRRPAQHQVDETECREQVLVGVAEVRRPQPHRLPPSPIGRAAVPGPHVPTPGTAQATSSVVAAPTDGAGAALDPPARPPAPPRGQRPGDSAAMRPCNGSSSWKREGVGCCFRTSITLSTAEVRSPSSTMRKRSTSSCTRPSRTCWATSFGIRPARLSCTDGSFVSKPNSTSSLYAPYTSSLIPYSALRRLGGAPTPRRSC